MNIVIIDKNCNKKEVKLNSKDYNSEVFIEEIFKKCGYRIPKGDNPKLDIKYLGEYNKNCDNVLCKKVFEKENNISIVIFGRDKGKSGMENKYELPPPFDNNLYFGSLCLIKIENNNIKDLRLDEWENYYEKLYGGFDDVDDSDEDEDEYEYDNEDDNNSVTNLTKHGYKKDGFVVDDNDENDSDINSELTEEEYYYYSDDYDY